MCIFCKIATGDISARMIYENDEFCVFLDQYPASPGHTLVIPKAHYANIFEMPSELVGRLYELVQRVATSLRHSLDTPHVNILQNNGSLAGQTVFHYHVHIIPRYEGDGVTMKWSSSSPPTETELERMLSKLSNNLH